MSDVSYINKQEKNEIKLELNALHEWGSNINLPLKEQYKQERQQRREQKLRKAVADNGRYVGDYISAAIQSQIKQIIADKEKSIKEESEKYKDITEEEAV